MSTADDLAAVVAGLRPLYEDVAMPDWCEVIRPVTGSGFNAATTEQVVEVTRCALGVSERSGIERTSGDRLTGITIYTCDLPWSSIVRDTDTLRVNGREFAVTSVGFAEGFEIGRTALLEARS